MKITVILVFLLNLIWLVSSEVRNYDLHIFSYNSLAFESFDEIPVGFTLYPFESNISIPFIPIKLWWPQFDNKTSVSSFPLGSYGIINSYPDFSSPPIMSFSSSIKLSRSFPLSFFSISLSLGYSSFIYSLGLSFLSI